MSHSEQTSWVKKRKIVLATCLVLAVIYLTIYIRWRVYQNNAVEELVQAIKSINEGETDEALEKVKSRSAEELAISRLMELLESDSKAAYLSELSRAFYGFGSEANSRLIEKIQPSEKNNTRLRAIYILGRIGRSQSDPDEFHRIVHSLLEVLDDKNRDIRFYAAEAISRTDPSRADETLPVLVELLKDPHKGIRIEVISLIGLFGNRAGGYLPEILPALKDSIAMVRVLTARTICEIGVSDKKAINSLVEMLSDENPSCQREAAASLGHFGTNAKTAVPALLKSLKSLQDVEQDVTRSTMIDALGEIGHATPEVIQTLITTLNDKRYYLSRESAAVTLGKLGPRAIKAVPDLVKIIQQQSEPELATDAEINSDERMEIEFENTLKSEAANALKKIDLQTFNRVSVESVTKEQ